MGCGVPSAEKIPSDGMPNLLVTHEYGCWPTFYGCGGFPGGVLCVGAPSEHPGSPEQPYFVTLRNSQTRPSQGQPAQNTKPYSSE